MSELETPPGDRPGAQPAVSGTTEIRGRRQWPLPKQAVPDSPLLTVQDLAVWFRLPSGTVKAVDGVNFGLNPRCTWSMLSE